MHAHHRNAVVNHVHPVARHDVGDGSAAAEIDAPELRELIADAVFIHHAAQFAQILCTRITGAGLAARASELVEHHAASEIGDILLLECVRIERVIGARNIRGEHP